MYTLLPLICIIAAVSSTDLQVGPEGGKIIYDSKVIASPAIWTQVQNLTVNATGNEVISRVVVTDLRPNKDGVVKIIEGGEGQKNVTLELKSPTVLRGFEFQIQVYASPDRKSRETVADIPVESGEVATPVETSVPIANDTVINEDAKPITTDVVNGTAASGVETPVAIEQMKKRDTAPEVNKDNGGIPVSGPQDTNAEVSDSEDVAQETEGSEGKNVPQENQDSEDEDVLSETHKSDNEEMVQEPAVQQQTMKKRDTSDMSQVSQVEVDQSQASVDSDEDIPQESEDEEVVEEPVVEQTMNKRDTDDMSQQSQADISQSQVSVDSDEDMSQEPEGDNQDSQESDSEEIVEEPEVEQRRKRDTSDMSQDSEVSVDQSQVSVDSQEDLAEEDSEESGSEEEEQQQKRAAQELPQIQISGDMPEIQIPDVQLPEIQMPDVQWSEVQISDGMPQVQIGEETEEQPKERAAQETPETEGEVPQENLGEEVSQDSEVSKDSEQLPQDPIAQYVSDQNESNEHPIQAPLVPEVMLEENNSTHFNDSAPIVERSANKYEEKTEPTTTEETTTTETPTEPTTTEKPKKDHHYHHHHNWHDSHGYY